jgi:site-specific DNA recombinase
MKKMAIYCRVSTRQQAEKGKSIETQKAKGLEKAKELGFQGIVYTEKGKSASKEDLTNRPILSQLLDDISDGSINALYVIDEDRLSRNMVTKIGIKKVLADNEVTLYSDSAIVDFKDEDNVFLSDLKTLLGELETKKLSKRIRRVLKNNVKNGGVGTGTSIPFGYINEEKQLAIDETKKELIQWMFQQSIKGLSTRKIANKLTAKGIPTPKGGKVWADVVVYNILTNTTYYGERYWSGEYFKCPAIITKETFERSLEAIKTRGSGLVNEQKYIYLLNDLVYCGDCGRKMRGRYNKSKGENIYKCTHQRVRGEQIKCNNKSINRPYFEQLVKLLVNEKIGGKNLVSTVIGASLQQTPQEERLVELNAELETYNRKKSELMQLYTSNSITFEDMQQMAKTVNQKIHNIKSHISSIVAAREEQAKEPTDLSNFNRFGAARQIELLKEIFGRIVVNWIPTEKYYRISFYSVFDVLLFRINMNTSGKYNGFPNAAIWQSSEPLKDGGKSIFAPVLISGQIPRIKSKDYVR